MYLFHSFSPSFLMLTKGEKSMHVCCFVSNKLQAHKISNSLHNSKNHGLRGSIQFRGSLAFAQHVRYTKQHEHFKKSFSRLGCHHQKGGECNCKLLKSYLKHVFWWRQHGHQLSKDVQKAYQHQIKVLKIIEELLKKSSNIKMV